MAICVGSLQPVGSVYAGMDKVLWLITPQEASMAPAPQNKKTGEISIGGEIDLGPRIDILKPSNGGRAAPPIEIEIKFTQKTSPVDLTSLKVSVVKFIDIDITGRVLAYATTGGIHVPSAQLPTGKHTVRISIADQDGLRSIREVIFEVL